MMPSEWVPSPDSSYASSGSEGSGTGTGSLPRCEISLLERLIRTHPLWFLPSLQRSGAFHLLQGREVGNFIVRASREPDTMALSVKLLGNQVEHYLLKAKENRIALQDSSHSFPTVHQLVAHYCENSDEIPVCLRVPNAISEATTRQQLRSLALLGQEFWTISSPSPPSSLIKDQKGSPPSDGDSSQSHPLPSKSSGIGSQSSSSQNSLSDLGKKPCRPTTLELGRSGRALITCTGVTPQSVPVSHTHTSSIRWNITTPTAAMMMSQSSSVQSTPSEMQSSVSERVAVLGGGKARRKKLSLKSIHYKDTEIIDLFKGTKTMLDDKISDYEDVWSHHSQTNPNTPNTPPPPHSSRRLFTFKPDVIPNSTSLTPTPDFDYYTNNNEHRPLNHCKSLSLSVTPTTEDFRNSVAMIPPPPPLNRTFINNRHRFSLKNVNINNINEEGLNKKGDKGGVYSEPVDSINFIRNQIDRNNPPTTIINNRWSQPVGVPRMNSRIKRHYCKSTDNLNHLLREQVSDENISNQSFGSRTLLLNNNPSCWQLDKSWQFSSNQKTEELIPNKEKNKHNLRLSLSSRMEENHEEPLSPSPENWNHLLNIVNESSRQLESIETSLDNNKFPLDNKYSSEEGNESIRKIVVELSQKSSGVFGPTLKSFISCTLSAKVQDPFKVLGNIRQFMSGMKNYLAGGNNAESKGIHQEIKKQTEQLKPSEFLNVDLILEQILVDLVIQPLYYHVMVLLDKFNNGRISPINKMTSYHHYDERVATNYAAFEKVVSPIQKLSHWNQLISEVQNTSQHIESFSILLTSCLRNISPRNIESHADFIIALLSPSISENNSYSLSLLQSVASALKSEGMKMGQRMSKSLTSIKVIVPDERNGTLITKVLPVKDSMTTKEVSKTLSSKLGILNVSDYALFTVREGQESILEEHELIQRCIGSGSLAFKRIDSKIGWPLRIV